MSDQNFKKQTYKISGLHCASCEVVIERQLGRLEGVQKVNVSRHNETATVYANSQMSINALNSAVEPYGYALTEASSSVYSSEGKGYRGRHYAEIGAITLIVLGIYTYVKYFNLIPTGLGISEQMGLGLVFGIGVIASLSTCMAVTGGLLLAVSAQFSQRQPDLTSRQKVKPLFYFNVGRVFGYAIFGAAIGALGSALTLSPRVSGVLTLVVSAAMIFLGLQLLNLFPALQRLTPRMPKFIAHRIHNLSASRSRLAPFSLGSLTFFLPCGFTQALQLYVLSQGSVLLGASVMLMFALGSLPALLVISFWSSFSKGAWQQYLFKTAGVIAVLAGLLSFRNGVVLAGNPFAGLSNTWSAPTVIQVLDPNISLVAGKQVVTMAVNGTDYVPYRFTVVRGVPVEWQIDGSKAAGCMRSIIVPKLGIRDYLPASGIKTIAFTPTQNGTYEFSCAMGMGTYGAAFVVVDPATPATDKTCDPKYSDCLSA